MKILFPNEVTFRGAGGKDSVLHTPESQEGIEIAPGIAGKRGNFSCSLLPSFWKLVAGEESGRGQEGSQGRAAGQTSVAGARLSVVVVVV